MSLLYTAELAQLSEGQYSVYVHPACQQTHVILAELQSQRESISKLREELRKARSSNDDLSLRYDDEVYNGAAWKKERERLETKIADLSRAYDSSIAAQAEQQSQLVALHSQTRELRSVLNDAEADRALLQKARRGLQAELENIKLDAVDATRINSDRELQTLQLKNQDLERALEESADRVDMASARMKKAELHAQECQVELGQVRVENSELDKLNVSHRQRHDATAPLTLFFFSLNRLISRSSSRSLICVLLIWRPSHIHETHSHPPLPPSVVLNLE
jgi:chromosome segregation ATPase